MAIVAQAIFGISLQVTDEMTAGELLVGIGTLALALFTAWLAKRTSREVQLNEISLALTRESIEALDRPFVIATPNENYAALAFLEPGPVHPGMRFAYRLWNIGKGPAIVEHVSLKEGTGRELLIDSFERAISAPGVRDELNSLKEGIPGVGAQLSLQIHYRSAAGRTYTTVSRLLVVEDFNCICESFQRIDSAGAPPKRRRPPRDLSGALPT